MEFFFKWSFIDQIKGSIYKKSGFILESNLRTKMFLYYKKQIYLVIKGDRGQLTIEISIGLFRKFVPTNLYNLINCILKFKFSAFQFSFNIARTFRTTQ